MYFWYARLIIQNTLVYIAFCFPIYWSAIQSNLGWLWCLWMTIETYFNGFASLFCKICCTNAYKPYSTVLYWYWTGMWSRGILTFDILNQPPCRTYWYYKRIVLVWGLVLRRLTFLYFFRSFMLILSHFTNSGPNSCIIQVHSVQLCCCLPNVGFLWTGCGQFLLWLFDVNLCSSACLEHFNVTQFGIH